MSSFNTSAFGYVHCCGGSGSNSSTNGGDIIVLGGFDLGGKDIIDANNICVNGCIKSDNPEVIICQDLIVQGKTTTDSLEVANGPLCMPTGEPVTSTNLINVTNITGVPTTNSGDGIKDGSLVFDTNNGDLYVFDGTTWQLISIGGGGEDLENTLSIGDTTGPHNINVDSGQSINWTDAGSIKRVFDTPETILDILGDDRVTLRANSTNDTAIFINSSSGGVRINADTMIKLNADTIDLDSDLILVGQNASSTIQMGNNSAVEIDANNFDVTGTSALIDTTGQIQILGDGGITLSAALAPSFGAIQLNNSFFRTTVDITNRTDFNDFTVTNNPSYFGRVDFNINLNQGQKEEIIVTNSAIDNANDMVILTGTSLSSFADPLRTTFTVNAAVVNNPVGTFAIVIELSDHHANGTKKPSVFYQIIKAA